jgi:hypothetical protein
MNKRTDFMARSKVAFAGAALLGMTMSWGAIGGTSLDDLSLEVGLLLQQLDQGQIPLSQSAIAPVSATEAGQRLEAVIAAINEVGAADPSFTVFADADTYQPSSTDLWRQAEMAYQTLVSRCEYWRDHADGPASELVGLSVVAERIQALEIGSRMQSLSPVEVQASKTLADVQSKLDDIYVFVDVLNASIAPVNTARISTSQINRAINNFYDGVLSLCPEEPVNLAEEDLLVPLPETEPGVAISCEPMPSAESEDGFETFCEFIPFP